MPNQLRELRPASEYKSYADRELRLGKGQFANPLNTEATLPIIGAAGAKDLSVLSIPEVSSVQHCMQRGIVFDYVLRSASTAELVELLRILQNRIDEVEYWRCR